MDEAKDTAVICRCVSAHAASLGVAIAPEELAELAAIAADEADRDDHLRKVVLAARALQRYFEVDTPGLWRDRMNPDGSFVIEPAPASTLRFNMAMSVATSGLSGCFSG